MLYDKMTRPTALLSLLEHFVSSCASSNQNFYLSCWLLLQLLQDLGGQPSRLGDQHFVFTCTIGLTISEVELMQWGGLWIYGFKAVNPFFSKC